MEQTTSIIVPVHNVQKILKERISALIEIFADLTTNFEIRIVDDASTDTTLELAMELAKEFPQVSVSHRSKRQGLSSAAEEEIAQSNATTVLVHNVHEPVGIAGLRELCLNRIENRTNVERIDASHQIGSFRLVPRKSSKAAPNVSSAALRWLDIPSLTIDRVTHG